MLESLKFSLLAAAIVFGAGALVACESDGDAEVEIDGDGEDTSIKVDD